MRIRTIILGVLAVVVSFVGATLIMNVLWPASPQQARPPLAAVPPLQPLTRTSTVLAPIAITIPAIRDALKRKRRAISPASGKIRFHRSSPTPISAGPLRAGR